MPNLEVGVVDVYVVQPREFGWRVLTLRRAADARCPGAWETVHGSIDAGENPEDAAIRELSEETGLIAERLYSITVQPFYVVKTHTVQLAVVFAAFVGSNCEIALGIEHQAYEWLSVDEASQRFFWPAERAALQLVVQMLGRGDAGEAEDVLRVR